MKYVISVGAGQNQIPFIQKLVELGYKVVAFDLDPEAPGRIFCCDFKAISTWDYDAAIQWLTSLEHRYSGVGCFSYGKALITEKMIANYFQLPSTLKKNSYMIHSNKNYQKTKLYELGINQYKSYTLNEVEDLHDIKQFIVKPLIGGSSMGVSLKTKEQLLQYKNHEDQLGVIEPYLQGEELSVTSIIQEGEVKATFVIKRENLNGTFLIGRQQATSEYNAQVNKLISVLITEFSINNSALKLDLIVTLNRLEVIEMDFGIAGDHFETHIAWDFFNYNYIDNYINLITGKRVEERGTIINNKLISDHLYNLTNDTLVFNEEIINIYLKNHLIKYKIIRQNVNLNIALKNSNMDAYLTVIHTNNGISNLELNEVITQKLIN